MLIIIENLTKIMMLGVHMKKFFFITLVGSTLIFALLTYYSTNNFNYRLIDQQVVVGKQVWQRKGCTECHTLFGNGGYNAPDLTYVVSKLGRSELEDFLSERPIVRTSLRKRHIKLSKEEISKVVNFLGFINSVEIPKWPPKPRT